MKTPLIDVFTRDPDVDGEAFKGWPYFILFTIFDALAMVSAAGIRASGKQKLGAIVTFFAYFAVGIPLSIILVFSYNLGIIGVWCGPLLAVFLNAVIYIAIFKQTDWPTLIAEAEDRRLE